MNGNRRRYWRRKNVFFFVMSAQWRMPSALRVGAFFSSSCGRKRWRQSPCIKQARMIVTDEVVSNALYLPSQPSVPIRAVAAPMVAASDYAFRCLCRQYGVDLVFSQMLHAKNVVHDETFRRNHFDFYECAVGAPPSTPNGRNHKNSNLLMSQINLLGTDDSIPAVPRPRPGSCIPHNTVGPLVVQLAGNDENLLLHAAQLVMTHTEGRVAGIDLNCGCPQGIARKGNYGAFLMEREEDLVFRILSRLRKELPESIAVSAKIRLPTNEGQLPDRMQRLVATGVDFLTIHGRNLHENKTRVGPCRDEMIAQAVRVAQAQRPGGFAVIANGGVERYGDAQKLSDATGAAAVMSSEGLLETPNLFALDSSLLSSRQVLNRQIRFAREYLQWCTAYPPLPGVLGQVGGSMNIVRGHLFKFLHRFLRQHVDLRDCLASHKLITIVQAENLVDELHSRFTCLDDEQLASSAAFESNASWYRRHWDSNAHNRGNGSSWKTISTDEATARLKERLLKRKMMGELAGISMHQSRLRLSQ